MYCSRCGSHLTDEELFCAQCGKKSTKPIINIQPSPSPAFEAPTNELSGGDAMTELEDGDISLRHKEEAAGGDQKNLNGASLPTTPPQVDRPEQIEDQSNAVNSPLQASPVSRNKISSVRIWVAVIGTAIPLIFLLFIASDIFADRSNKVEPRSTVSTQAAASTTITPASGFSNGLAVVERDGKYGYIDTTGRVVIPVQFELALSFRNGVALVYTSSKEGEGFQAYIDATGKIIFDYREYETIYDEIFPQHEGLIGVVKKTPNLYPVTEQYGFIDLHGNIIMPLQGEWKIDAKTRYSDGVVWLKNTKVETQRFNYNATEMITETHTFSAFNQEAKPIYYVKLQKVTDSFLNGVKQNQQFECDFMMGCAVVSLTGTLDYSSADSRFARGLPLEHVAAYEVWNPTKGKVFYRQLSKYLSPPLNITFPTGLGDGYILVCTDTEMKNKNGQFLSQYNFLDVNTGWMSDNIDLGGSGNRLKSKETSGFSEDLIVLNVWGEDGKDYSYYVDKEGRPVTEPQTEYVLGEFNGGYAVWKKLDDKGQAYAYIVNRDMQILSQPIPIDDDSSSNYLRFQDGYCLLKQNGVMRFIDTQGKELSIQDYQEGQAPVELTDEMRIPDLSAPTQTPPPAPQSPLSASPSAEPTQPPQASPSPNSYPITDNTPIDEIVDMIAGGMYFVNRDNGYVAYIVDVWDGCGSVFVNGKELLQFEVYDYKHEKGDISTGPLIKFYGTNPEPEDLPVVTFNCTNGWIRITGEYEGERFNGIYDYAPTEPPIPSDRVWGDYSSPLLDEMSEGMGEDYY